MSKFVESVSGALVKSPNPNTFKVRLITAGQGSSGFYPAETLDRDIPIALPKGTKVYFDHMGDDELETGRARSMENLVGVFESDPFSENGQAFANVRFYENAPRFHNVPKFIQEAMSDLGVSIEIYDGVREDDGTITELGYTPHNSLAVVTAPGARGRIESLAESFRTSPVAESKIQPTVRNTMDEKEIAAIAAATSAPVLAAMETLTEAIKGLVPEPKENETSVTAVAEAIATAGLSELGRKAVYTQIDAGAEVATAIEAQKALEDSIRESLKSESEGQGGFRSQESSRDNEDWAAKANALFGGDK